MRRRRRLLKISSLVTYSCLASQSQFLYRLSINQILNLNWAIWAMWAAQGSKEKNYTLEGGFHWQNLFLSYLDILVFALKVDKIEYFTFIYCSLTTLDLRNLHSTFDP